MKHKIGIICAGNRETAPLIEMLEEQSVSEKALLKIHEGKLENLDVAITTCGVCKVNAAMAAQILIDTYGCKAIFNGGTAGGMDSSLHIYDTIVTAETYYWDVEVPVLGEDMRKVEMTVFPADPGLLSAAKNATEKCEQNVVFGKTVTGERFIDQEMREEINDAFHPLSVDMETTAIAHVCRANDVPFIAVRCITDTEADSGLDTYEVNCDRASELSADFVRKLLQNLR